MPKNDLYIPLTEIDRRIEEIEEKLRELPIELSILRQLRSDAVELDGKPVESPQPSEARLPGPKLAILQSLHAKREGVAVRELIGRLEDNIDSAATDRRRTLHSTLANMRAAGLIETKDGVSTLTPQGERALRLASKNS